MPGTPAVCAGISLPVISIVVHWQDGCAPNTFSGLSDVLASLKFPSSNVCGATTPKSNPAGMAITLALAAGAEAARIGFPIGFVGVTTGACAVANALNKTTLISALIPYFIFKLAFNLGFILRKILFNTATRSRLRQI